jgi:O-antigen/teichoic acid export membrane protein
MRKKETPDLMQTQTYTAEPAPATLQPMKRTSLKSNFFWTLLGNSIYAASQWGILIALAKLGSPEMLGTYTLGVAICTPIFMLFNLKLAAIQVTDARNEHTYAQYVQIRFLTNWGALIVISVVLLALGYKLNTFLPVILVGIGQFALSMREIHLSRIQKDEQMHLIATSNIILAPLGLGVFVLILWASDELALAISGVMIMRFLVMFLWDRPQAHRLAKLSNESLYQGKNDWLKQLRLMKLGLSLGIVATLGSLTNNIPNYFLDHFQGREAVGYYGAMVSLLAAGTMVIAALGQSSSPRLAKYYVTNRVNFRNLAVKLVIFGLLLGILAVAIALVFGKWLLTILYTPDYARFHQTLVWLMLAGAFMYLWSFMECCLTAARFFRIQIPIYSLVVVVGVAGSRVLIPHYQLLGAAWSLSFAYGLGMLLTACAVIYAAYKPEVTYGTSYVSR